MDMRGKNQWGKDNHMWKGGKYLQKGRMVVKANGCSRAFSNGYVLEHIVIAEKILGKPLPKDAVVHHVDGDKSNISKNNLVICENDSYHRRIHMRMRGLKACGNANWRICTLCKKYDDPKNLYIPKKGAGYHTVCHNKRISEYRKKWRAENCQTS